MYRDPSSQGKKVRSKTKTTGRTRSKAVSVSELWTQEISRAKAKPKSYSIKEKFDVGDIIDHKKFGPGIVQEFIDDKISVLFQHEIKTLVHGK